MELTKAEVTKATDQATATESRLAEAMTLLAEKENEVSTEREKLAQSTQEIAKLEAKTSDLTQEVQNMVQAMKASEVQYCKSNQELKDKITGMDWMISEQKSENMSAAKAMESVQADLKKANDRECALE